MKVSTTETYNNYVKMAKDLLHQIECHQVQISYYATKVCEIRHGGKSDQIYTLSKFAKDIGLTVKTLQNWVQVYRNVIQKIDMDVDKVTAKDWQIASRVNNLLTKQRAITNATAGKTGSRYAYKQSVPKATIKNMFKDNSSGRPSMQVSVLEWRDSAIAIRNKLTASDLSGVSASSLIALKEALDQASENCLRHISLKTRSDVEFAKMSKSK